MRGTPARASTNRSGSSQKNRWPRPSNSSSARVRDPARRGARRCGGRRRRRRCRGGRASDAESPPIRSSASNVIPAAACACQPRGSSGLCEAVERTIRSTSSGRSRRVRERVLDEAPQRDLGRQRGRLGDAARPSAAASGTRGPPGVVQARTSLSTRSGRGERELLRDHAAEARADDVRALDPGRVEHGDGVRRPSARAVYGPGRHVALADAAVVVERARGSPPRAARGPAPSPSVRSRALHEQQRRPGAAHLVGDPNVAVRRLLDRRCSRARLRLGARRGSPRRPRSSSASPLRRGRSRARPTSPPGRKNTSRMKSVPEHEQRLGQRHAQHARQVLDALGVGPVEQPVVEERVERAAEDRAPARAGATDHDHEQQREREGGRRHVRRRAADQQHVDDAARRWRGTTRARTPSA